jgi:hypothetical protein
VREMGIVLSSKREQDKIIVETLLDRAEMAHLRGEFDDVHLFSERAVDVQSNISGRGKNEATKYFLIPSDLRKDLPTIGLAEPVLCQRINTPDKAIFIYVVKKTFRAQEKRKVPPEGWESGMECIEPTLDDIHELSITA